MGAQRSENILALFLNFWNMFTAGRVFLTTCLKSDVLDSPMLEMWYISNIVWAVIGWALFNARPAGVKGLNMRKLYRFHKYIFHYNTPLCQSGKVYFDVMI